MDKIKFTIEDTNIREELRGLPREELMKRLVRVEQFVEQHWQDKDLRELVPVTGKELYMILLGTI